MGVRKFRSVTEMPTAKALVPLHPDNLRIVCALMKTSRRLSGFALVPGVRKFRTIEEAEASRQAWEVSEIRRQTRTPK